MQYDPTTGFHIGRKSEHIEEWPWMPMVGVDESKGEFIRLGDFPNKVRFAAGMHADIANELGNQLRNLEADRPGRVEIERD